MKLQSVELQLPDVDAAVAFLEKTWRLVPLDKVGSTVYLRGSGNHPYLLSLTTANAPAISSVSFSGSETEVAAVQARAHSANVAVSKVAAPEDWQWPPGRIDQWGLSIKDVAKITAAEKRFRFLD